MARKRRRPRIIYIADQRWKVQWDCRLRGVCGTCDYGSRTIQVGAGQDVRDLVDTILHEMIHARWPDLNEEAVCDMAETMSGFLDASGLLRPDDHPQED